MEKIVIEKYNKYEQFKPLGIEKEVVAIREFPDRIEIYFKKPLNKKETDRLKEYYKSKGKIKSKKSTKSLEFIPKSWDKMRRKLRRKKNE